MRTDLMEPGDIVPTVWIVKNTRKMIDGRLRPVHDTQAAESWGTRRTMIPENCYPWDPEKITPHVVNAVHEYDLDHDYLIPMGSPVEMSIACAAVFAKAIVSDHPSVKMLYWSWKIRAYYEIVTPVDFMRTVWID